MTVLLSIKPEYAFKIFDGTKRFEFRRVIFKNPNVRTVVVYASSPVQRVIGEFEVERIISATPEELWQQTMRYSGIAEEYFYRYFACRSIAHAIKIKNTKKYAHALPLQEHYHVAPPQSYVYL